MTSEDDFRLQCETLSPVRPRPREEPTWREKARRVIGIVIAQTRGRSRREIRRALRAVYFHYADRKAGRAYKVWCEECAYALRERSRKSPKRHGVIRPEDVMPAMRGSVARLGALEVTAVLDVDDTAGAAPENLSLQSD